MKPEIFIAKRLTLGNGSDVPLGIKIGVAGVALAFTVMLLSLSIVIGFKNEIKRKVMGFEPPITLVARDNMNIATKLSTIRLTDSLASLISETLPTAKIEGAIVAQGMLKTDDAFNALLIKCVTPSYNLDFINGCVVDGAVNVDSLGDNSIALSESTARSLGLKVGDKVFAHFIVNGNLKTRRLKITGLFDTNFEEYDANWGYASTKLAESVYDIAPGEFTQIEIEGIPEETVDDDALKLGDAIMVFALDKQDSVDEIPIITTSTQRGAVYFNWLELLDTNVVVIVTLMLIVSGFTLISSLFILILQRVSTIGLLKSIGATNTQIRSIFIYLSQKIVFKGLLYGNIIGISLILLQHYTHIFPLDPESYYLSYVPTDLNIGVLLMLNAGTIAISLLTLVVPSLAISRMSPTSTLRHATVDDNLS